MRDISIIRKDGDEGKVVPLSALVIIRIMCGSDFDRTASKVSLDKVISDDRHLTV